MPIPKPLVRRFGQVDFNSMTDIGAANDADVFVMRRGPFGSNRTMTRAAIIAGAGGVPDPLLLNDGSAAAPTYSFASETNTGVFLRAGGGRLAFAAIGVESINVDDTGLFSGQVANSAYVISDVSPSATIPVHAFAGNPDTGLGTAGNDILSFIAGGVQIAQAKEVVGANQFIVAPGLIDNNPALPTLAFGNGDTGFFESVDDVLNVAIAGIAEFVYSAGTFQGKFAGPGNGAGFIKNLQASASVPTIGPSNGDFDTGIGAGGTNQLVLIAGGLNCINIEEIVGARAIGFYVTAPIALQTGVAVTDVAIHAALVALGLITA